MSRLFRTLEKDRNDVGFLCVPDRELGMFPARVRQAALYEHWTVENPHVDKLRDSGSPIAGIPSRIPSCIGKAG